MGRCSRPRLVGIVLLAASAHVVLPLISAHAAGGGKSGGPIVAIDARTGDEMWRKAPPRGQNYSTAFTADGAVFATSRDPGCESPQLARLDPSDGDAEWGIIGSPNGSTGGAGVVLLQEMSPAGNSVRAVDVDSGDERWKREMSPEDYLAGTGTSLVFVQHVELPSTSVPIEDKTSSALSTLRRRDGTPAWRFATSEDIDAATGGIGVEYSDDRFTILQNADLHRDEAGQPVIGGSVFRVLNSADGTERFRLRVASQVGAPLVLGPLLAMQDGKVVTVRDLRTGAETWKVDVGGSILLGGSVEDDAVYVAPRGSGDSGPLVAFDLASGDQLWESRVRVGGLAVTDDGDLLGSSEAAMTGIDPKTGKKRWSRDFPKGIVPRFGGLTAAVDAHTAYLTVECDI